MDKRKIDGLRKRSREVYLNKRVDKKLKALEDELEDEENLFGDVKVTKVEERTLGYKKNVYKIVEKWSSKSDFDGSNEYRLPPSYDSHGFVSQKERFRVVEKRDGESEHRRKRFTSDHDIWEDQQVRKATVRFGALDKKNSGGDYPLIFGDRSELLREAVGSEEERTVCRGYSGLEDLKKEKESLPVFEYKDKLLQAICDHQVVVVVGETGSGKTTQIPQYLHEAGYTKLGKIGCTQPRRVAAMSVAARVAEEMGVKLGHEVGYSIRFEDCTSDKTVLKYMTDGMLLREFLFDPELSSYSVLIIDEAHERTLSTDILFGLLKDIARHRPDVKLLISSATLNAVKFSDYFDCAPIFLIPGRRYPVKIDHITEPVADYLIAAVTTVLQIHVTRDPGDILVFLTGQEEIEAAEEVLLQRTRDLGSKFPEFVILPIYANLPTDKQAKIFEPTPRGARKVVLATNIAETSVTIDGIKYVVDPGFCKIKSHNPRTGMESLKIAPISKASAKQRAGRAGRTGPGECVRLYTSHYFEHEMSDDIVPEIQRANLANVVLTLKSLGIDDVVHFDFMDPPPSDSLLRALELLYALGALGKHGELTKVGRRMSEFPLDPMLSKMIIASEKYQCSEEIITIAAMLSVGYSIFYSPKNKRKLADAARDRFYYGDAGDHIGLLRVYNEWRSSGYDNSWCYENYVQLKSLKRARDIREQLEALLEKVEIQLTSRLHDLEAIEKAIASGFFPHVARKHKSTGSYKMVKLGQFVHIHPSSGLANSSPQPEWVVFHECVLTKQEYMRQVTGIKPEWLLEIAPHYYQQKDVTDSDHQRKMLK